MSQLKLFLLLTFASLSNFTHSSHSFENSSFTLQAEDENFDLKFSNFSSHDLHEEVKDSQGSNVHWIRRETVSAEESESNTHGDTWAKSSQFEEEAFSPANYTRNIRDKEHQPQTNSSETFALEEDADEVHSENSEDLHQLTEYLNEEPPPEPETDSFTSVVTKSISKVIGNSQPQIEKRQDKMAIKQMKMQMIMNKMQMKMQTITNVMAMKMMMKMKMKKMKYDMKKKKMKMKMEMAKIKEKKKICKACKKGCEKGGKAEPELVKIDRIKLKKVPMPVDYKSYKKMSKGGKGAFKLAGSKYGGGYSFPEPLVNPEPELLALPEPEVYTKKQMVSYDYQNMPNYYDYPDYSMPNMTMMMMMMSMMTTTTTTPAPMMVAPAAFVTFPSVNLDTGRKK